MIKVHVILHSYLREKLPPVAKGRADLEFPEGACIRDVMKALGIPDQVICVVNSQIEHDREKVLVDRINSMTFTRIVDI